MQLTTKKGYNFFEATSAFQKAIRRSDEPVALYFAVEFFNSGYDEYLWKRIKVITSEDIGLADPNLISTVQFLHQSYSELKTGKKDNKPERLFLIHAVLLICRSKKSRLVDLYMVKLWREHDSINMKIPDYAYDMHSRKGKSMGRGIDHFYKEGDYCKNLDLQPGELEVKKEAIRLHKITPGKLSFATIKKGTLEQKNTMFED